MMGASDLLLFADTSRERGFIRAQDGIFIAETGKPWPFYGYTIQTLLVNLSKGEDVGALLDDVVSYGYNTVIFFGTFLGPWYTDHGFRLDPRDPRWPGLIARTYDQLAAKGLRGYLRVLQTAQELSVTEQQQAWHTAGDVVRARWNAFLGVGNESNVNGWHEGDFDHRDLGGVLQSRGSQGGGVPSYTPHWDFSEWEPRRDPVYKAMDDAGAGVLELIHGYTGVDGPVGPFSCPMLIGEGPAFHDVSPDEFGDTRWTDPKLALQLGLNITANVPGGAFLASDGMIGKRLQPHAAECARQQLRGMRAAFVR